MGMLEVTTPSTSPISISITPSTVIADPDAFNSVPSGTGDSTSAPAKRRKKVGDKMITTAENELPMAMSNVPYLETYAETNNILRSVIGQLDQAAAEISEDLDDIRASKTLRRKYDYISPLQSSRASLISAKIAAAREMNSTIKSSHDLDMKRNKELKLTNETDDVKNIQDMYNAFVSMPVSQNMSGPFINPLGPTTIDFTPASGSIMASLQGQQPDVGYQNYLNNMTPEQATMLIEDNPHINHVVAYDPATGAANFAIFNEQTQSFVEGVPTRSNEMFMPGLRFDFDNGQAISNDLNESYAIINVSGPVGGGINMTKPSNKKNDYSDI